MSCTHSDEQVNSQHNYMTTQHCPRHCVNFVVNKTGTLFHRDAAGNPLMVSGEDFGRLKCYVPFNWKVLFNMTQLPSSKKTQDLTKLPEQFLCRGNASNCLWQQTARVSKTGKQGLHYINCPESQTSSFCLQEKYLTAEQRKRVLPSGRVTTSPKPIVIHWNQPCTAISYASFPLGAGGASPGCHTVCIHIQCCLHCWEALNQSWIQKFPMSTKLFT